MERGDRSFDGLSLDLWFTTLTFRAADRAEWRRARLQVLSDAFRSASGASVDEPTIATAVQRLADELAARGSKLSCWDPARLIERLETDLGASIREPREEVAARLSEAGLREHPPQPNPEALELVSWARREGIPVVILSNSARRPETWSNFLRSHGAPGLDRVVTASRIGVTKPAPPAFHEAARLLGTSPARTLHVGDCWHADVLGARAAGFSIAWYQGLWPSYPDEGQEVWERSADDGDPSVHRLRSLREIPTLGRADAPSPPGSAAFRT